MIYEEVRALLAHPVPNHLAAIVEVVSIATTLADIQRHRRAVAVVQERLRMASGIESVDQHLAPIVDLDYLYPRKAWWRFQFIDAEAWRASRHSMQTQQQQRCHDKKSPTNHWFAYSDHNSPFT